MFLGDHYIGNEMHIRLKDGEYWKKVYGPVFVYLNSAAVERDAWQDAKAQVLVLLQLYYDIEFITILLFLSVLEISKLIICNQILLSDSDAD